MDVEKRIVDELGRGWEDLQHAMALIRPRWKRTLLELRHVPRHVSVSDLAELKLVLMADVDQAGQKKASALIELLIIETRDWPMTTRERERFLKIRNGSWANYSPTYRRLQAISDEAMRDASRQVRQRLGD